MDFRRTEASRPRMRRENEEVDVEEVAAVKPRSERRERRSGWRCFEALSFVEDVSYPRERALVNRRGRLGVASATPQPHSPNCRLARLSVLYLNTWRICSLGRCLLLLYALEGKRVRGKESIVSRSILDISLSVLLPRVFISLGP